MAVDTTTRKQTFAGGQTNLTFSFTTLVNHPEYIKGIKTLISTGAETDLTYGVDFSVVLANDGVGGVVTMTPSVSTGYNVTIYRETTNKQESDYNDYNQFPADTLEADLDRRTMVEQELSEAIDRSVKLPISSEIIDVVLPLPQDGLTIVWSGTGGTMVNIIPPTGATGAVGPQGATGDAGPTGGTTGQMMIKSSNADYAFAWAPTGGGGATGVRGTFTNANSTTGSLLITYATISSPYTLSVIIADSNGKMVIPDNITFAATGATINVTSLMPLAGTWSFYYLT